MELESTQAALSASLLAKQQELCRLQAESDGLDWDTECLRNTKRWVSASASLQQASGTACPGQACLVCAVFP